MSTLNLRAPASEPRLWPEDVPEENRASENRESKPIRVARVVGARFSEVSESDALHGTIGVAMVALLGDPRLAVRAARVLLEDSAPNKREFRARRLHRARR